jgi:hypothetical protein
MVHIDPEDDEAGPLNVKLPLRDTVITELQHCWQRLPVAKCIERINLHYLRGAISVDVYLPLECIRDMPTARDIAIELNRLGTQLPYVKTVKVFYAAAQICRTNLPHKFSAIEFITGYPSAK